MRSEISTFEDFWPFYVSQHLNPVNRRLHFFGTTAALLIIAAAAALKAPLLLLPAFFIGYGFAWTGHFFYERNRPATFTYPLLSLRADFRMYRLTLRGEMDAELLRLPKELKRLRTD